MILADKMIALRKRAGWSQEELAEKLGVSRQSVSKWEGAQSMPDLDKILALSRIFGVSTDYLLKDEIEDAPSPLQDAEPDGKRRRVTMEDADRYLTLRRRAALKLALATALCILSPITLILLGALSETAHGISEGVAAGVGLAVLLGLVAVAVALFIYCGAQTKEYEYLDREPFETEYGVSGMVREKKARFAPLYTKLNIIGTVLCVLAVIPLITVSCIGASDLICVAALCILFAVVAVACVAFVWCGTVCGAMDRLLEEGDFRRQVKKHKSVKGAVSVIYWVIVTAVFLFLTWGPHGNGQPKYSWIVWAVGGVLYAGVMAFVGIFEKTET